MNGIIFERNKASQLVANSGANKSRSFAKPIMFKASLVALSFSLMTTQAWAAPLAVDMSGFRSSDGMTATERDGALEVTWDGSGNERVRIVLDDGETGPVIRDLSISANGGSWQRLMTDARFEFSIVEGLRRISNQQLVPLRALGVELTQEVVDRHKWDVFWDAPLDMSPVGDRTAGMGGNPPPVQGVAGQPGLPRDPSEIRRGTLRVDSASVKVSGGNGAIRLTFPGAQLGTFSGDLVVSLYRGTNLIQAEVEASTQLPSVAYKYDAGIGGLAVGDGLRVVWNDTAQAAQSMEFTPERASNSERSLIRAANRVVAAEVGPGSVAAFPPPHVWYWAREVEVNLGNNYYRKDADNTLAIGVGQAEAEIPQYAANWSLYSAPAGSVQHMRAYLFPTLGEGQTAISRALEFTNGDVFPEVAGYKRMGAHYHIDAGRQWLANGTDFRIDDFDALRSAGLDIISLAERPRDETQLAEMDAVFRGAALHSDKNFLVLPNQENYDLLGGHWDLWFSKPTFYTNLSAPRTPDQPLVMQDPTHGRVYQLGSKQDIMTMVEQEDMLIYMPHPRTKGSTGYPDAIRRDPSFLNERYRGAGWLWGMGVDLSDRRMSGNRALDLLDDMNNWAAQERYAPKYLQAITETYFKGPGDDIYGGNTLQYVKLDALPTGGDYSPITNALMAGDYFMSTGEVRLNSSGVQGSGARAVYRADVSWTFPLDFIEVVWGDGTAAHTVTVPATEFGAFGRRVFEVPVDLSRAAWVRFAAWDVAGNGAFNNPVALDGR